MLYKDILMKKPNNKVMPIKHNALSNKCDASATTTLILTHVQTDYTPSILWNLSNHSRTKNYEVLHIRWGKRSVIYRTRDRHAILPLRPCTWRRVSWVCIHVILFYCRKEVLSNCHKNVMSMCQGQLLPLCCLRSDDALRPRCKRKEVKTGKNK